MELNGTIRRVFVAIVATGLLMARVAQADAPPNGSEGAGAPIQDVVLLERNVLLGQVVDADGRPGALLEVSVQQNNHVIVTNQTTEDGRFAVSGLRSGVYQISTPASVSTVRLWTPEVAPPVANSEAVVVSGGKTAAGATARGGWGRALRSPWVIGGIVAAVAIPLALDDNGRRRDDPDAS